MRAALRSAWRSAEAARPRSFSAPSAGGPPARSVYPASAAAAAAAVWAAAAASGLGRPTRLPAHAAPLALHLAIQAMSHFAGNTLDRQSARRSKVAELAAERRKQGRFLAVSGLRFLQNEHGRVAWLEQADLEPEATEAFLAEHTVYLGMDDNIGRPYWAVDVTKNADLFASWVSPMPMLSLLYMHFRFGRAVLG
nr:hypothetical protein HK105_001764 [Polyrhizophydium stewartii]